ncbi:hypothetical protein BZG36_02140 [Bifiguratus adelaidae]|uniref:Enoyl reductase (ER) domain-containing protein n=1 Tax=Bifiguratus adelaidae TaxID=1938954 RepID=A0A261Y344_9FUNG|nr:hypothetical protein BZG36_02140 [Bifiguratus adelaidae]
MTQTSSSSTGRRGVVFLGKRQVEVRDFEIPTPGQGEVRLQVKASTLCGSDLNLIYRKETWKPGPGQYKGCVGGHEPCGIIDAVGPGVTQFKVGDRCVVYHISGCGTCHDCRKGWFLMCKNEAGVRKAYGYQRDGGHSNYMLVLEQNICKLPDELTYVDGAMTACGVATAYTACCRANVSGRDRVLVTGLGPVGVCLAMLAKAMGAMVWATEVSTERCAFAEKLGIQVIPSSEGIASALLEVTNGKGFEVCFDASGNGKARHLCLEVAREWGRVVYVGEGGDVSFSPSPMLLHKQITLYGSWVCNLEQMEDCLEFLARWNLHPETAVTHRYSIEDASTAYEMFDAGKTGKVAFVWE